MSHLARLVVFYPRIILAVTLALALGCAAVIVARGMTFNLSPESLARSDGALTFFNEVRSTFGDDRVIIVALTTNDVFTSSFFERLDRLTHNLAAIKGVAETQSLTNIKCIRKASQGISLERLVPSRLFAKPAAPVDAELQELKESVTADPLYARHFVSRDGRSAAINVFLKPLAEQQTREFAREVERVAKAGAGRDELLLSGVPIIDARGIDNMVRDMLFLSPVAAVFCFLVFLVSFRSFWGAALPTAALLIGLVCTIGVMSALGKPITITTLSLPTVLMAVGSSYMFHVLNQYRLSMAAVAEDAGAETRRRDWLEGLNFIVPSVLVSGTATMAGFGALASSPVPTARDMGIVNAVGVLIMLGLTLAFVPAVLALLPRDCLRRNDPRRSDYALWLNGLLRNTTAAVLFRARGVLIVTLAVTVVLAAGAAWLRIDTDYLKLFPESSETVQSAEKLHERLAGAATVQLIVTGEPGSVRSPDVLRGVGSLEQFARAQPGVDATISVAGIVARLNGVLSSGDSHEQIPRDPVTLKSIFDEYLSQDDALFHLVSRDFSRANVVLRTNLFGSNELRALTTRLEQWSRDNLPAGISARATGSVVLLNDASDAVADSQLSSLALAVITIYAMMVLLFGSFSTGLLALIPNLAPIVGFFGFMGWSGISLDISTSLVASAALGLAVDNAVHMIRRYRQSVAERGLDSPDAEGWVMWLTMLRTGKPMILANAMLIGAFLVFMLSSFVPVRVGGLLWAITIAACLAADLVLLPVLMRSKPFARAALGSARISPRPAQQQVT